MPFEERPAFTRSPMRRAPAPGHHAPPGLFSRRSFLAQTSMAAGAAALAPLLLPSIAGAKESASIPQPRHFGPGLDAFIRNRMRVASLTSLSTAAVDGTTLEWSKGYGLANREQELKADADTVYMLASVSKTFIAAAVMQLWEAGSIDIDADVNGYLPFPVRNPAFPDRKITARMLMTHTSSVRDRYGVWGTIEKPTPETGYTHGDSPLPLGEMLEGYLVPGGPYYIKNRCYYENAPGSTYRYSNIGADVAAYLVEAISGVEFGQYCLDNLLKPLGMVESGYHLTNIHTENLAVPYHCNIRTGVFHPYPQFGYSDFPCGCMRTSANALSVWLRCFINEGSIDGTQILKPETVKEIMRPQLKGIEWGQGLIWYRVREAGNLMIGHNGSDYGVATNMYFLPDRKVGSITLTNRILGGWTAWYAFLDIQDAIFNIL